MTKYSQDFNNKFLGRSGLGIIKENLIKNISPNILDKIQIIVDSTDHFEVLDDKKIKIYWCHLDPIQNEEVANIVGSNPKPLANGGWKKFDKIVFISYHQMESWINFYQIPRSHCTVIKYALNPIESKNKENRKNKIILFHNSSPQRGLSLLVDVFEILCKEYTNLELRVHSSWKIYNSENNTFLKIFNDKQIEYEKSDLYNRLENNSRIKNIGYVPNNELKKSLISSDIFVYPSIMKETFCLSLLEAMSAKLLCVHSNYGCLPETAANFTMMYDYHEDVYEHKKILYQYLKKSIEIVFEEKTKFHIEKQKEYVDYFFNWEKRSLEWTNLINSLLESKNKKIKLNY